MPADGVIRPTEDGGVWGSYIPYLAELEARIVTVDLDGRTIRYDKVAEAEAALAMIEAINQRYEEALRLLAKEAIHPYCEIARKALADA